MSTRSKRSKSSRRKRRTVDFDTASVASSNLSGFMSTPSVAPRQTSSSRPAVIQPTGFAAWKQLPDGRYNYSNGKWHKAPMPKYFWSPNTNMYEIVGGRLFYWPG